MTWKEFQLKRIAYERQEKNSWLKVREISYLIYLSIPQKGTKMSKEKFMPLEKSKVNRATNEAQQQFLEEVKKFWSKK